MPGNIPGKSNSLQPAKLARLCLNRYNGNRKVEGGIDVEGETVLIAFDSTQQALRAEMLLEYADIDIDTRPTPKEITAGCALSIEFPLADYRQAREIIEGQHVEIRGYFRLFSDCYHEIDEDGNRKERFA
jgi:Protein of unknown function (DUF3343)